MRKTKIVILLYAFLMSCEKKNDSEELSPKISPKPDQKINAPEVIPLVEEELVIRDASNLDSGFQLQEVKVDNKNPETPTHIDEVNSEIQTLFKKEKTAPVEIWKYYLELAESSPQLIGSINEDLLMSELSQSLRNKRIPDDLYVIGKTNETLVKKALYGLYLASSGAVSNDGMLYELIETRSQESEILVLDIEIYQLITAAINQSDGHSRKLYFNDWRKSATITNPVYKLLAIQLGNRLKPRNDTSSSIIDKEEYYTLFINDRSQIVRFEALKHLRELSPEISSKVFREYNNNSNYFNEDQEEVKRIFNQ